LTLFLIAVLSMIFRHFIQLAIPLRCSRSVLYRYSYLAGFTPHSYTISFNIVLQSKFMSSLQVLISNFAYIFQLSHIPHLSYICDCTAYNKTVMPVCGSSLVGFEGSKPARSMDMRLVRVLCLVQLEVYAVGRSLVQRIPAECGMSVCDREASILKSWPTAISSSTCVAAP
jgi:hypothetical protein